MCARGDAWVRCDDRCVSPIDGEKVVAPSAYVLVYLRRGASPELIREALPRREEDSVDVSALLAGVTKSRRSRSTSARPVKQEEPAAEEVKPITLKRRLLNTMGFTKTPRERSSSEDSSTKHVEAEPVGVVSERRRGSRRR